MVGRVVSHVREITLSSVTLYVNETARQRVLSEQCRSVHAWAIGQIVEDAPPDLPRTPITYNPYRAGTFTTRIGEPVYGCAYVEFTASHGALAVGAIQQQRKEEQ